LGSRRGKGGNDPLQLKGGGLPDIDHTNGELVTGEGWEGGSTALMGEHNQDAPRGAGRGKSFGRKKRGDS